MGKPRYVNVAEDGGKSKGKGEENAIEKRTSKEEAAQLLQMFQKVQKDQRMRPEKEAGNKDAQWESKGVQTANASNKTWAVNSYRTKGKGTEN